MSRIIDPMTSVAAPRRLPHSIAALGFGLLAAAGLWLSLEARAASTRVQAGVVFVDGACDLSPGFAGMLGGPLSSTECAKVERIARAEVAVAFEGLRLEVTNDARSFWTVHVRGFVPSRSRTLGAAGASVALGPLGGRGIVGLTSLAAHALGHAPTGTPRAQIVAAIGRGVGRSVVHELAHQIVGGSIDSAEEDTYEYGSADRAAQYYGVLRWGSAGERVRAKLGG